MLGEQPGNRLRTGRDWQPGTIAHTRQPAGGRGLTAYEDQLGFTRNQLANCRILDLGAGPEAKLAQELAVASITGLVVSLSPDYSSREYATNVKNTHTGPCIAGIGQELPFADNSFDVILGLHVCEHVSIAGSVLLLREMNRALRPGGWARLGPLAGISSFDTHDSAVQDEALRAGLAEKGNVLARTLIDPSIVPPARLYDEYGWKHYADAYLLTIGHQPLPQPTNIAPQSQGPAGHMLS